MPYIINNSRGDILTVIPDGTTDTTTTSLALVGKNVTPYGEIEVQNLVKHLENFAKTTAPTNPVEGQLWWNITSGAINVFTGLQWKTVSGMTVSATAPSVEVQEGELWLDSVEKQLKVYSSTDAGPMWITNNRVSRNESAPIHSLAGDLYFDTTSNQLFISNGSTWQLIGPEAIPNFADTKWETLTIRDLNATPQPVVRGIVDGEVIAIVAKTPFTIYHEDTLILAAGFTSIVPGINLASGTLLNGVATQAQTLAPGRTINGVPFDGSQNITISSQYPLTPGLNISGSTYDGSASITWNVNADSANSPSTIVARDSGGGFSAGTINANLIGSVTGIANNVNGIVATQNGGTGQSTYTNGQLLIGNSVSGGLDKSSLTGTPPIVVTNTAGHITISYTGGTGSGSVSSVAIAQGAGISVSGSPITGSGTITVSNSGVTSIIPGPGLAVNRSNGDVTISLSGNTQGGGGGAGNTIIGGDAYLANDQTFTGRNQFAGNLVASKIWLSDQGTTSHFSFNTGQNPPYVNLEVAGQTSYYFGPKKFVVNGSADVVNSAVDLVGGTVVGVDNGINGGSGVLGIHTNAVSGWGVGVGAYASNGSFTGAVLQASAARGKSSSFVALRCYAGTDSVFAVDGTGNFSWSGVAHGTYADYAEYFEWEDGNPHAEDRRGITVTLVGNKIKPAVPGDKLLGVVSATPGVVGDSAEVNWNQQYLKDVWGCEVTEAYHVYSWTDESGNPVTVASYDVKPDTVIPTDATVLHADSKGIAFTRPVLNPAYDPNAVYTPRSQRKEWSPIGLLGKLKMLKGQPVDIRWVKMRDINEQIEEWFIK